MNSRVTRCNYRAQKYLLVIKWPGRKKLTVTHQNSRPGVFSKELRTKMEAKAKHLGYKGVLYTANIHERLKTPIRKA